VNIERIQIEGGFLNGVDLTLSAGLNVLIGARGTGKTSIIELIRYALDVRNMTSESKSRSLDHARAVLDGGEICVTLNDLIENISVSRSADEDKFRASSTFTSPIILSQTEIETVGLSESGRLSLIDGFLSNRTSIRGALAETANNIRSFYKELEALEKEIISLGEGIEEFQILQDKISQLELEQKKFLGESDEISIKQLKFGVVSSKLSELSVKDEVLQRFSTTVENWFQKLESQVFEDFGPEEWDGSPEDDPLSELRIKYSQTIMQLDDALGSFMQMKEAAKNKLDEVHKSKIELEKESRAIRGELDHNTAGAGALARKITLLRANAAQIQSRQKLINERKARLAALRTRRDSKLEELLELRANRSTERKKIVEDLNEALTPWVKVELEGSAQFTEYTRAIANALRGSGMKYNELALNISEKVSPQELMDFVEYYDFETLSQITSIPKERCARLLGVLAETGISDIVTSEVEDNIKLTLLDGLDYKDVAALSAGQRCTVILSIVLQHRERMLIIDQPEDHLDNSFIANTVIKALVNRKGYGQVILSTHNANIPVLGQADLIIEMTSDGRNGYVQMCKPLDDLEAVEAITNVMEGGAQAFATRARFYAGHS